MSNNRVSYYSHGNILYNHQTFIIICMQLSGQVVPSLRPTPTRMDNFILRLL